MAIAPYMDENVLKSTDLRYQIFCEFVNCLCLLRKNRRFFHLQVSGDLIGSLNIVGVLHLLHHSQIKEKGKRKKEKIAIIVFFLFPCKGT